MERRTKQNLRKVNYRQIEVDSKEIGMRVSRAFEILFNEVIRLKEISKSKNDEISRAKI